MFVLLDDQNADFQWSPVSKREVQCPQIQLDKHRTQTQSKYKKYSNTVFFLTEVSSQPPQLLTVNCSTKHTHNNKRIFSQCNQYLTATYNQLTC